MALPAAGEPQARAGSEGTAGFVARCIRDFRQVEEITHLVVALGPGSYTGVRAGMAAAAGAAHAGSIPLFGVPTLELAPGMAGTAGTVRSVTDAGRGGAYVADYRVSPGARPSGLGEPVRVDVTSLTADGVDTVMGFEVLDGLTMEVVDHAAALAAAARLAVSGEPLDLKRLHAIQVGAPEFARHISRV